MKLTAALGVSLHIEITAQDRTIALDQTPKTTSHTPG